MVKSVWTPEKQLASISLKDRNQEGLKSSSNGTPSSLRQSIIRNMPIEIFDYTKLDNIIGFIQKLSTLFTQIKQVKEFALLCITLGNIINDFNT